MYLSSTNFSLHMAPVLSVDSGEYFCLVNDQRHPSLVTRILVQGRDMVRLSDALCMYLCSQEVKTFYYSLSVQTVAPADDAEVNHSQLNLKFSISSSSSSASTSPFDFAAFCRIDLSLLIWLLFLSRCCMHFCIASLSVSHHHTTTFNVPHHLNRLEELLSEG